MLVRVHIDEKWFHIHPKTSTIYVSKDEETAHITAANRNVTIKVLFIAAVAQLRYDPHKKCLLTVTYEPAKRASRNRPA